MDDICGIFQRAVGDRECNAIGTRAAKENAAEWTIIARQLGEAWMHERERETGQRPTVRAIAIHVEGELRNRNIAGKSGKFLDRETIKSGALTGITGRTKGGYLPSWLFD